MAKGERSKAPAVEVTPPEPTEAEAAALASQLDKALKYLEKEHDLKVAKEFVAACKDYDDKFVIVTVGGQKVVISDDPDQARIPDLTQSQIDGIVRKKPNYLAGDKKKAEKARE
jgi:hypothetical protein